MPSRFFHSPCHGGCIPQRPRERTPVAPWVLCRSRRSVTPAAKKHSSHAELGWKDRPSSLHRPAPRPHADFKGRAAATDPGRPASISRISRVSRPTSRPPGLGSKARSQHEARALACATMASSLAPRGRRGISGVAGVGGVAALCHASGKKAPLPRRARLERSALIVAQASARASCRYQGGRRCDRSWRSLLDFKDFEGFKADLETP